MVPLGLVVISSIIYADSGSIVIFLLLEDTSLGAVLLFDNEDRVILMFI